ncbi:MAG TPA: hypothetical protein VFM38_06895 [Candidatus Limnocylindrales bacterium]|nr:hypothetical protein [Candidatus Limnocylindrales bacterium]
MPMDPPIVLAIAVVALFVASSVAQRTGAHADAKAGRARVANADRRGALGPVVDLVDRSVAAYTLRSRLGLSTLTREERRMADRRAAAIMRAEEIRLARDGAALHLTPARLVVAGATAPGGAAGPRPHPHGSGVASRGSTLSVELLAAVLGLAVVIGVVIGIWPRERGAVLSATGAPSVAAPSPSVAPGVVTSTD